MTEPEDPRSPLESAPSGRAHATPVPAPQPSRGAPGRAGFEWLVAWRYLRDPDRPLSAWLFIGLVMLALGVGLAWLAHGLPSPDTTDAGPVPSAARYGRWVFIGGAGLAVLGAWTTIFGACLSAFRLFTTISIFGVFFGTQALIVVLAVMSGFEGNLRRSILGNNPHVEIRRGHKPFPRDLALERALFDEEGRPKIAGLRAASPFLKDEVILSGPKQHSGVYLKGIDPKNPFSRSLVGGNLLAGTVDNLLHPERLVYLSSSAIFLPPPGEDPADLIELDPKEPGRPAQREPAGPRRVPEGLEIPLELPPPASAPRLVPKVEGELPRVVPPPAPTDRSGPRTRSSLAREAAAAPGLVRPTGDPSDLPAGPAVPTPPEPAPYPGGHLSEAHRVLPAIIIGRELAKTLGLSLGQSVDVISTKSEDLIVSGPMPRLREFRLAGIFHSGHYEYDLKYAYVALSEAQEFLRTEGRISGLELRTTSPEAARAVAERVRARLGFDSGYEVQPWQEIHRAIFSALQAEKLAMFVVLVIIVIVAAFSIVANLIMVVAEKSAEISVLRAMGARPRSVLRIFLYEGVYIGAIGMVIGVTMGIILSLLVRHFGVALDPDVYYIQAIPVAVDPLEVIVVASSVLGISLLAALFPAVRAMGLRPVEGLRFK